MDLLDFLTHYGQYHSDSTFVQFEFPTGTYVLKPCTQVFDEETGLYHDAFRNIWTNHHEDFIGIFRRGEFVGYITEDGVVHINEDWIDFFKGVTL